MGMHPSATGAVRIVNRAVDVYGSCGVLQVGKCPGHIDAFVIVYLSI